MLSSLRRTFRLWQHRGSDVYCPCCEQGFQKFLDFGVVPRSNALCPGCESLERHRLLWLWMSTQKDWLSNRLRVLHIAPERVLQKLLKTLPNVRYQSADLRSPLADLRFDITDIPLPDASYDLILCNHVLEHIPNDYKAMTELRRILAPTGIAILQCPIDNTLAVTAEDLSIKDRAERLRRYGNEDHVRQYGRDYGDRLKNAGFQVECNTFARDLPLKEAVRYGLIPDEDIYVCRTKTE